MKKSDIYKIAQACVVQSTIETHKKLMVLRELMEKEDLALFVEKQEALENAE